jgi:methylated-DNA-protein-cysteine methyltransferase related protein
VPALGMVAGMRRGSTARETGGPRRRAGAGQPGGFRPAVLGAIGRLGPGEVATYGEIAREAGYPGAARAVGQLLARGEDDLAWWRVVTRSGRLVPGEERRQAALLRAEGVEVDGGHVRRKAG